MTPGKSGTSAIHRPSSSRSISICTARHLRSGRRPGMERTGRPGLHDHHTARGGGRQSGWTIAVAPATDLQPFGNLGFTQRQDSSRTALLSKSAASSHTPLFFPAFPLSRFSFLLLHAPLKNSAATARRRRRCGRLCGSGSSPSGRHAPRFRQTARPSRPRACGRASRRPGCRESD